MKPQQAAARAPRAILYLRQSTHRDDSISIELQESAGRAYAKQQGYDVVAVESDEGISGRTWNRPAVQRLMATIAEGGAEVVILWKWSRLSRNRLDWAVAIDKIESVGGRVESATEQIDTSTATGRLSRGMLAEFAAFESERIGDVWKETHERRRRKGLPAQGGDRYGYTHDAAGYIPDPVTGSLLADMYRRYLGGEGFTSIARWLNTAGHPTPSGGAFTRSYVTRLLDAGFGAGQIMRRQEGQYGTLIYYPGAHDGVITEAEWLLYKEKRQEASTPPHVSEPKYMLTGLIRCGDCGAPMHAANAGGKRKSYVCSAWARGKSVRCVTAVREYAEAFVMEWLNEITANVDRAAEVAARSLERKVTAVNNASAIDSRIRKIDTTLGTLTVRWLDGKVPEAAYAATSAKLQADRDSLVARRKNATSDAKHDIDLSAVAVTVSRWDELKVIRQRGILAELIERVEVIPPTTPVRGGNTRPGSDHRTSFRIVPRWQEDQ